MQKNEILKAQKMGFRLVCLEDSQNYTPIAQLDDGRPSKIFSQGMLVTLLSTEPIQANNEFAYRTIADGASITLAEVQAFANTSYGYKSKTVWAFKGTKVRDGSVVYGYAPSKCFTEVLDPALEPVLAHKKKKLEERQAKEEEMLTARRALEVESRQRRDMARQQMDEQFSELLGRPVSPSMFDTSYIDSDINFYDVDLPDGTKETKARIDLGGSVRVSYEAWMMLMAKLERVYDQLEV